MFKPYGALIGGALIAALSIAGNNVLTKLSPGYRKVKKQVINWLSDIFESLSNWTKKGKWILPEFNKDTFIFSNCTKAINCTNL